MFALTWHCLPGRLSCRALIENKENIFLNVFYYVNDNVLFDLIRLIPNYRVTSARHVSSSRQLVTSARHVGLSRSAIQYLFTPKRDASVRSLYLSWLRIGELVSKSAHIGNLVSKSLHRHNIFITNYRVASRQLVTSARHVGSSRWLVTLHEDTSHNNTTHLKLTNKNTNICQSPPQESFDT